MRAAADIAEVARARRDRTGVAEAVSAGTDLWQRLQPILDEARARQRGQDLDDTNAEAATTDAERQRLLAEPTAGAWHHVAESWGARDNPYLRAYGLWREAEALLGDGDRPAAAESLAEAYRIASGLGARPLASAIEALAARARLDLATTPAETTEPEEAAAEDPFGLTRRERDVLPLLVKGRTNRQIAEELFISENTAGVHVSNILGKMGATSRTEAAGMAARLGIGISPDA
jgi:DNA-binding CsgD family transcriptional regulator